MSWIGNLFSTKRTRFDAAKPDRSPVLQPLPVQEQFTRLGGGLTPASVSTILREADTGSIYRLVDLANESRQKDCHLQGILHTREIALSGLRWNIKPSIAAGADVATESDKAVAWFCEDALANAKGRGDDSKGFGDLLAHMQTGVYHGFAVAETDYTRAGMGIVPVGFFLASPRRFGFNSDTGMLEWRDQNTMRDGVRLQQTYPYKFIQHQPRVNGDVPTREGLSHVLIWSALFRNWDIADWMKLAELSWKPWRFGVYKKTASTEDINELRTALQYLTTNGVCMHSERVEVNVEWPERERGTRPGHSVLAEFMAMEMSKAVLGQTLTVESGERGARSLGEVHDRVRLDIREADAVAVATTIQRDILAPLVKLNFGAGVAVPEFAFVTEDAVDVGAFARACAQLVQNGLAVPQWWVRDRIGAPEPRPDEDILSGFPPDQLEEEDVDTSEFDEEEPGDTEQEKDDDE